MDAERRLIEGQFPCREVGAETKRERGASSSLPPLYFLHVWWARRPLTPSRAAILGSILSDGEDPSTFLKKLGIVKKQAIIGNQRWVLVGKNIDLIDYINGHEVIRLDSKGARALKKEILRRERTRELINKLYSVAPNYADNPHVKSWFEQNEAFVLDNPHPSFFEIETVPASPADVNELIDILSNDDVRECIGSVRIDPEDSYGYLRAYESHPEVFNDNLRLLDLTAGGGSIPFEALRLGCNVVANDLNPVASVVEKATLEYPYHFRHSLIEKIDYYGSLLSETVSRATAQYFYFAPLNEHEQKTLMNACQGNPDLYNRFNVAELDQSGILYYREVTCPHCGERAPLLNSYALLKKSNGWGVSPVVHNIEGKKRVVFEPFRLVNGKGRNGEDITQGTVDNGVGRCLFCGQAIESDEIKRQACGSSSYGEWRDRLYCIAAVREQPKLGRDGNISRYASGPKRGEPKIERVTFYREPVKGDFEALEKAHDALLANWDRWDAMGIIPTERIPNGHKTSELHAVGIERWCDLFTSRQLLVALIAVESFIELKKEIFATESHDEAEAISTYLQFMIDKVLDYNSRQTLWDATRGTLRHTFTRHDFSLKWTFGEMISTGSFTSFDWAKNQITDAYSSICDLMPYHTNREISIINGTAANIDIEANSIDVICFDPPYYNNVQYAELSDYFYVWDKRGLKDIHPDLFARRLTNKDDEAVANPVRDGSADEGRIVYESLMSEIFLEAKRVLKNDGIMVMMFTHKQQEAWEALIRAIIDNGWIITSTMPVESEDAKGIHHRNMAATVSSIFIACRKRNRLDAEPSVWEGFGGGVVQKVREAVEEGLNSYAPLHLSAIDEMVASYGCALRVLSENWPVIDGDELVSPITAMREASMIVAQYQMTKLTGGRLDVKDVDAETGAALTLFGVYGHKFFPYDDALSLSKSLNIRLENQTGGYRSDGHSIAIAPERTTRGNRVEQSAVFYAPLVRRGSKLRIAKPEERNSRRLDTPQSEWDIAQGTIQAYRDGDIPVARAYLNRHATGDERKILDILDVLADGMDGESKKEIQRLLYGMR